MTGSDVSGRDPGSTALRPAPSSPSYTVRTIGAGSGDARPCLLDHADHHERARSNARVVSPTGPHVASQDVSCLPNTSAVPVLPPICVLYDEPSNANAPETASSRVEVAASLRCSRASAADRQLCSRSFGVDRADELAVCVDDGPAQCRLPDPAAVDERGVGHGKLQRRHRRLALADRHVGVVTGAVSPPVGAVLRGELGEVRALRRVCSLAGSPRLRHRHNICALLACQRARRVSRSAYPPADCSSAGRSIPGRLPTPNAEAVCCRYSAAFWPASRRAWSA